MARFNWAEVDAALRKFVASDSFRSEYGSAISAEAKKIAEEAGDLLVKCLEGAISSSGLSGAAIAAIGDVSRSSAYEIGRVGNEIRLEVQVEIGQQRRPSLAPGLYGGVNDMAALLNNGYQAGGRVFGEWHGNRIGSLEIRPATHFVQNGVDDFNGNYGATYNAVARITDSRFN